MAVSDVAIGGDGVVDDGEVDFLFFFPYVDSLYCAGRR